MIDGNWLAVRDGDARARALYLRHYSSKKSRGDNPTGFVYGNHARFIGPGEHLVMLTHDARALFSWRAQRYRQDGQQGIECTIFRNEGAGLSSELIREACELAWLRWPGERLYTYVEDSKVASANPGYCFLMAGWRRCGRNADGRLTILERLP